MSGLGVNSVKSRAGDNTSDWLRHALNSDANLTEGNQIDLRNQSSIERQIITNQHVGMSAMLQQHQTTTLIMDPHHLKLSAPQASHLNHPQSNHISRVVGHFEGSFVASPTGKETNTKARGDAAVMFFSNE